MPASTVCSTAWRAAGSPAADAFLADFHEVVRRYGSRGANEWDVIAPTWEVQPATALTAIDLMRRSDESERACHPPRGVGRRARSRRRPTCASSWPATRTPLAGFEAALRSAQLFLSGRERYKTNCIMVVNEIRMAMRELGRRLVERGVIDVVEQVFMLTNAELDAVRQHPERFPDLLADRWRRYQRAVRSRAALHRRRHVRRPSARSATAWPAPSSRSHRARS